MPLLIKANSVNNLSDGRYFATFAEWIGFNFCADHAHHIDTATAVTVMGWVAGVRIVGEFGNTPLAKLLPIVNELQLDTIQTDHDLALDQLPAIVSTVIRRIVVTPHTTANEVWQVLQNTRGAAYFMLDFQAHHITYHPALSPDVLLRMCQQHPILLAAVFTPHNIRPLTDSLPLAGIALATGSELAAGVRSFDDVQELIDSLDM